MMHERANFGQLELQMQYQRAELEQQLFAVSGVSNDRIDFLRSEQDAATVLLKQQHTQALNDLEMTMKQQHERVYITVMYYCESSWFVVSISANSAGLLCS